MKINGHEHSALEWRLLRQFYRCHKPDGTIYAAVEDEAFCALIHWPDNTTQRVPSVNAGIERVNEVYESEQRALSEKGKQAAAEFARGRK